MGHAVEITSKSIELLEDRFGTFHDSIIDNITVHVNRPKKEREIIVKISTSERNRDTQYLDWFHITFRLVEPLFYSIHLRENYHLGDIWRINLHATHRGVFIDFYPPKTLDKNPYNYYKELSEKREGILFMAAKKGFIQIEDLIHP